MLSEINKCIRIIIMYARILVSYCWLMYSNKANNKMPKTTNTCTHKSTENFFGNITVSEFSSLRISAVSAFLFRIWNTSLSAPYIYVWRDGNSKNWINQIKRAVHDNLTAPNPKDLIPTKPICSHLSRKFYLLGRIESIHHITVPRNSQQIWNNLDCVCRVI